MHLPQSTARVPACVFGFILGCATISLAAAPLQLGPEQLVKAGGADIAGLSYSVPSLVFWNDDNLDDLMTGEGSGKVRVHLNQGTNAAPEFANALTVQSAGTNLTVGSRASPAFADIDRDDLNDLLVGDAEGRLWFYENTGTPSSPALSPRAARCWTAP